MTKTIKVELPKMGEGVIEATITRWLAEINTHVEEDQPLVEVATDKVDSEIPAPISGILVKTFFNEGEIPQVGDVIAVIQSDGEGLGQAPPLLNEPVEESMPIEKQAPQEVASSISPPINEFQQNGHLAITPFIRHYATQRGIDFEELKNIKGSGSNGEILKADILNYFKNEKIINGIYQLPVTDKAQDAKKDLPENNYVPKPNEEVVELGRTRKIIAEHLVQSLKIAPHVTSTVEVDVTELVIWRMKHKENFKKENGTNLTFTSIILEKVVQALKDFPGINVSLYGTKLIKKKYYNIGVATALPNGNLVVPVIKNADQKNLTKIAIELSEQTTRARSGNLKPGETTEGTFTITNMGQFNNILGTPIINQPESAILAVGAIKKKPWVVYTDNVAGIGIRDILTLSLSYDHRIIDGALGGSYLNKVGELLEKSLPKL